MNEHPILEPMGAFFDRRADGYEEHQMTAVDGGRELYPFTASLLPVSSAISRISMPSMCRSRRMVCCRVGSASIIASTRSMRSSDSRPSVADP